MPNGSGRRNPMTAWWIGLVIILLAVGYVIYRFSCPDCARVGWLPEILVVAVVPVVYLALMYITLKDQAEKERQ